MQLNNQLNNQQIVIIGGSSGIGLATAKLAQAAGAKVTIAARTPEKLRAAAAALGDSRTLIADITDETQVANLFQSLDRVDHLFIAAGSLATGGAETDGKIAFTPLEVLKHPIVERVYGAVYAVRSALPKMTTGSITLMSGLFSTRPIPGVSMIAAAVAGVEAMTRAWAMELSPIRVNAVCPGYIHTPLLQAAFGDQAEQVMQAQAATLPTGRIGAAEEVAAAILFLMTNGFVTGEILHIDGGGRLV